MSSTVKASANTATAKRTARWRPRHDANARPMDTIAAAMARGQDSTLIPRMASLLWVSGAEVAGWLASVPDPSVPVPSVPEPSTCGEDPVLDGCAAVLVSFAI